jgi:hypothetical protein
LSKEIEDPRGEKKVGGGGKTDAFWWAPMDFAFPNCPLPLLPVVGGIGKHGKKPI